MNDIIQIKVGKMDNFLYIVSSNNEFVVVDPSWGFDEIKNYYEKTGKKLLAVLITHGHFDHTNDLDKIKKHFNDIEIFASDKDSNLFSSDIRFTDISLKDNIKISDFCFDIIQTPGHTPGSVCYLYEGNLFTGDTLFCGACGRVDLPGSNPESMRLSLIKLSSLPDKIVVWPGHNYNSSKTTIGEEKKNNIFIKSASSKDEFLSMVL